MTIYDIAKLAGVSASTVSRVMNGKAGVGEEKRKLITALLEENHYAPDENARSLVKQSTRTIGILTDDLEARRQNEGITRVENEIMQSGYFCFMKYIGSGEEALEEGLAELASRKVDGALMLGPSFADVKWVERGIKRYLPNIPVVLVHQINRPELDNVYCVGADQKKGVNKCVDLLVANKKKNIALFIDKNRVSEKIIVNCFQDRIKKYEGVQGWVYTGVEATVDGGYEQVGPLMESHPEIDGLFCVDDAAAIGAMYAFHDMGKRVPEDIAIIGEDNSELCEACRPRLTSMNTMISITTLMSAKMLLSVLEGIPQPHCMMLDMEIVHRQTV